MIYINVEDDKFYKEYMYSLEQLLNISGLEYSEYNYNIVEKDDIVISYSDTSITINGCKNIFIKNYKNLFNDFYKTKETLPKAIIKYDKIISFYSNDNLNIVNYGNNIELNIDIISDAFFMLSRYEEYIIGNTVENHNRFSYKNSINFKEGLMKRPVVNEYADLLHNLIKELNNNIKRKNIMDNKDFILFLSHDIDSISKYKDKFTKKIANKLLRSKDIKGSYKLAKNYLSASKNINSDPYWTFDYLMNIEKKYNISATYFFMSGGDNFRDNNYNINNKKLNPIVAKLKEQGAEIGLHGSFNSYNNEDYLIKEKDNLKIFADIKGIRQHFLRFNAPITWRHQFKANLKYDSSVGYAEVIGFRCGICSPFNPFDLDNDEKINIWEIPLLVMDTTLNNKSYQGLDKAEAIKQCKSIIDIVKKHKGIFSLLWHNSSLDEESSWQGWSYVYEEIIKYCYNENALGISGEKIIELLEKEK